MLDEIIISQAIIDTYKDKLVRVLDVDVAICGAGPSGLVCAITLAKANKKVVIFEKKLSIGGGMWGGGMMFNEIVVQDKAKKILDEFSIRTKSYKDNYYTADAVECVCGLGYQATQRGVIIINGISVEDVLVREDKVCGLVINWSAVNIANLHVDPLTIRAKFVVDATGHACEVVSIVEKKSGIKVKTKTGKILGEKSMWADLAESMVESNTKEVCPGLVVCGMCANSVFGSFRMGPIFGGMLLSGKRAAELIISKLD
ncbi:MAG: sulfide-dependent adenosine diphosphate thiazole synthase [Candidatus Omnitrophica bacterium]|nr:sulfide-dependent adenosine diphosphate thiazole synthase [Candidatus Omnitrophota bacterium]MCM8826900.1 sulfide-dependent adenosine diphosphate thiazole synthase [Candidatus Omnitrophota bacterium]